MSHKVMGVPISDFGQGSDTNAFANEKRSSAARQLKSSQRIRDRSRECGSFSYIVFMHHGSSTLGKTALDRILTETLRCGFTR